MQYLHQSTYGHAGEEHTAKPIFALAGGHLYEIKDGKPDTKAVYRVAGNKIYATAQHPSGASPHALFEIRGDKVHTTNFHPAHNPMTHTFTIR